MMLAEDLLLLAYDDDTGRRIGTGSLECALAGAVLIELVEYGTVDVVGDDDSGPHIALVDRVPTGRDFLDEMISTLATRDDAKPKDALAGLTGALAERLLACLAERGLVRVESGTARELVPVAHWPEAEAGHAFELRAGLREALVDGKDPDERTAALLSLLTAIDAVPRVGEADRATVKRRASTIAEGQWSRARSNHAVEEITAAVMVAALTPAATARR